MPTIRKRGERYFVDYYYQGKRYRKMLLTSNKRVAEEYLMSIMNRRIRGELGVRVDIPYLEFKEKYLDFCQKENRRTTYKRYLDVFNNFEKFIGDRKSNLFISQIDRDLLNSFKHHRVRMVSPYTVNLELSGLRAFLNEARKKKFLTANPFEEIHFLELPDKPLRKLSKEQYQRILFEARTRYPNPKKDSFVPALITYIYTGCRKSELINLKWEQIDFENKVIKIYSHDDFETKTRGKNTIALHPKVIEELQKLDANTEYVFPSPTGKRYTYRFYRKFKSIVKYLGLEWVRIHDLRHSIASYLAERGVSLSTIATILGHKNISTTMIYQHTAPSEVEAAINSLPDWEKVV